jgi:hypothetical protein
MLSVRLTYEAAAANGSARCHQHIARVVWPTGQCCAVVDAQVVQVQCQACTAYTNRTTGQSTIVSTAQFVKCDCSWVTHALTGLIYPACIMSWALYKQSRPAAVLVSMHAYVCHHSMLAQQAAACV